MLLRKIHEKRLVSMSLVHSMADPRVTVSHGTLYIKEPLWANPRRGVFCPFPVGLVAIAQHLRCLERLVNTIDDAVTQYACSTATVRARVC